MPSMRWRVLLVLSAVPQVILLMLYPLLPESPRYLLVSGQSEEAHRYHRKKEKGEDHHLNDMLVGCWKE